MGLTPWLLAVIVTLPAPTPRTRLVVVVTLDGCRADELGRYRDQLVGGLGRLLREGAVFTEAYQDRAATGRAPGAATLSSGRSPAHSGVVRDADTEDSTASLLGVAGPGGSPARFQGTSLFDWLRAQEPTARALSVSPEAAEALYAVGRAKEQVYWYRGGWFTTSRYYADSLATWVRDFNAQRLPFRAAGAAWPLLLSAPEYPELGARPDSSFPHHLPSDSAAAAAGLVSVPTMDSLTLVFALTGVRALDLGGRGATDLLAVGLSAPDTIGRLYGPESPEMHDAILRVDRYLGWFLGQLSVRFGQPGVLVVLTAARGPGFAESAGSSRAAAQMVSLDSVVAAVNAGLDARAGGGAWLRSEGGKVSLADRGGLTRAGVNVDSTVATLAARVRAVAGVARAETQADLARPDSASDPGPGASPCRHPPTRACSCL